MSAASSAPARREDLDGVTYKIKWPRSSHALYITINDIVDDEGRRRPFEIFINSKNMEHYAWSVGLTRMISAVFRRGRDVAFVAEELQAVFDPQGGCWVDGAYRPSLLAAIGSVVERHLESIRADTPSALGGSGGGDHASLPRRSPGSSPGQALGGGGRTPWADQGGP